MATVEPEDKEDAYSHCWAGLPLWHDRIYLCQTQYSHCETGTWNLGVITRVGNSIDFSGHWTRLIK